MQRFVVAHPEMVADKIYDRTQKGREEGKGQRAVSLWNKAARIYNVGDLS